MFLLSFYIILIVCCIQFLLNTNDLGNGGDMLALIINIAEAYTSVWVFNKWLTKESNKPAIKNSIVVVIVIIFIILITSDHNNIVINIIGTVGLVVGTILGIRSLPKDKLAQITELAEDNPDKFDVFLYENASQWTTSKIIPCDPDFNPYKKLEDKYDKFRINDSITLKYTGRKNTLDAMDDIIDFSKSYTYSRLDHILDIKEACVKKLSSLQNSPINIGTDVNPTYVKIYPDWKKFKYGVPVYTIDHKPSPILDNKRCGILEYHRLAIRLIDESDSYHAYLRSIAKEMNMKLK